ncbi:(deoxy)nucleoside triphosphate pyrophosphohydrolase [Psychrobacter sp. I-STPA10]|uniref:(deoxy)nucleoside triphosphate pyrophosphohydrolase n=1 Tax=Psychrobacter sp. I-STPA10 TaxID=2585769 RepID=UPI001E49D4F8|nr:(deoxy)nucleoside triphosphate pyrophosphohydrolase [Psychrobacter sp. I-STPA10]
MKTVEVVAAIIIHDGKILCAQRGNNQLAYLSGKFEFPGGKLEKDETLEQALIREIQEELNISITVADFLQTVKHQYPDFKIIMHAFICHTQSQTLTLNEHLQALWLDITQLDTLDWAAADLPIVQQLKTIMS